MYGFTIHGFAFFKQPPLYQEQWHDLEELKASLKSMGWPAEASDLSGRTSYATESEKEDKVRFEEFAEPSKRQTPTNPLRPELLRSEHHLPARDAQVSSKSMTDIESFNSDSLTKGIVYCFLQCQRMHKLLSGK